MLKHLTSEFKYQNTEVSRGLYHKTYYGRNLRFL